MSTFLPPRIHFSSLSASLHTIYHCSPINKARRLKVSTTDLVKG